ncbi:MAG: hypothetical protein DLM73_09845 [Chthoniobacterales bacterium]|nr:MAG: hypothetical protein DLM73_09845 [Chthoniobacterales bacterium]
MSNSPAFQPARTPDREPGRLSVVRTTDCGPEDESSVSTSHGEKIAIGHVLCVDIVGYSKLLIHEQTQLLDELREIVRGTQQFRTAEAHGKLLRLPTGDGMVLVFTESLEAPALCALEISTALKRHPGLPLRMGIHSGPINHITDVNDQANLAGAGINIAQRVMDFGDAGHILLTRHVAEDLEHFARWKPSLHAIGECEVKHGAVISVVNLYTGELGNPALPSKAVQLGTARGTFRTRKAALVTVLGLAALGLVAAYSLFQPRLSTFSDATQSASSAESTRRVAVPRKSIAVLPFENLSANQDAAYFADGMQDEILTDLAKVADLKVISRTSVSQYKTVRARNLREIGQQLGVAHVLEGSVQQIGDHIRVNAQLIDARTDAHIWAQVYDRNLADVFAIQTEIAKAIADQLQVRISPKERAALGRPGTVDAIAERLYVEAWQHLERASNPDAKESLLEAVKLLEQAVVRDPNFIRAYALLFTAQIDLYWQGFDHTPARLGNARLAIESAARVDPDAGEVHLARADYIYKAKRDYDAARIELELARPSLPNNPAVSIYAAALDRRQNRWEESIRNWERGIELDPRNYRYLLETAITYQVTRRYREAAQTYERALLVRPTDQFVATQLAQLSFLERGDVRPWRTQLSSIVKADAKSAPELANGLFFCGLAARDRNLTATALRAVRPEGLRDTYNNSLWAREWFVGLEARTFGNDSEATAAFNAARSIEAKTVAEQPDYAAAWSRLGLIDAALGRKEEAIREGRHACDLLPVNKDSLDGPSFVTNLAMIYAWTGETDLALQELAVSAAIPCGVTYGELLLYPQWEALRGNARFKKILASLAPKN